MKTCFISIYDSPIGSLYVSVDGKGCALWCDTVPPPKEWECQPDWEACSRLIQELQEYFSGSLNKFSTPIILRGTEFEKRIYSALLEIPYGETASYTEIAQLAGSPQASRAAGTAIGKNHLLLLIPCHRVVPSQKGHISSKSIGKYRAGSDSKRYLLQLEGVL